MKRRPLRDYPDRAYPRASERLVKSLFLTASMTATSLGGCAPAGHQFRNGAGAQVHDLDATVDAPVVVPAADDADRKDIGLDKGKASRDTDHGTK